MAREAFGPGGPVNETGQRQAFAPGGPVNETIEAAAGTQASGSGTSASVADPTRERPAVAAGEGIGSSIANDTVLSLATISIVDDVTDTGAFSSIGANPNPLKAGTFNPSPATNRTLLYIQFETGTGAGITGVAYGGQPMVEVFSAIDDAGFDQRIRVWALGDTGANNIGLATDNVFTLTGENNGQYRAYAMTLANADTADLIHDSDQQIGDISAGSISVDTADGGLAISIAVVQHGNPDISIPLTWTGLTERIENDDDRLDRGVAYDLQPTGQTVAIGLTHAQGDPGPAVLAGLSFRPGSILPPDRQAANGAGTGNSQAAPLAERSRAASGAGAGASLADGQRLRNAAGQAEGTGASDATGDRLVDAQGIGEGTGASFSNPSVISVTAGSGAGTSSAVASRTRNRAATGEAAGTAIAVPAINEETGEPGVAPRRLEDSYVDREGFIALIDMTFDGGEFNVWSLPFDGEFEGKDYQALDGLTGGISYRSSLDGGSPDASADLSGNSQELINIALNEPFQNRIARIRIGNLQDDDKTIDAVETLFVGRMVAMPVVLDADGSEVSVEINSIFEDLNEGADIRFSDADQVRINRDDRMFSRIETTRVNSPRFGG